jgi:transcription-repair coupling factor (superfamily II helicase)
VQQFWQKDRSTVALNQLIKSLTGTAEIENFARRVSRIRSGRPVTLSGASGASRLATVAAIIKSVRVPVIVVASRQDSAEQITASLTEYLNGETPVRLWPVSDSLPYELVPIDRENSARRVEILESLNDRETAVTVAPSRALTQMLSSPGELAGHTFKLRIGERIDIEAFLHRLISLGYQMVKIVREPGQVSRRGGIIDVFPPSEVNAVRIDLFGDEIDSLRLFDHTSQRSIERVDSATVRPPLEHALVDRISAVEAIRQLDTTTLRDEVRDEWDRVVQSIELADPTVSLDLFAPFLLQNPTPLLDHLPVRHLTIVVEPGAVRLALDQFEAQAVELRQNLEDNGELPADLPVPYFQPGEVMRAIEGRRTLYLGESDDPILTDPDVQDDGLGFERRPISFTGETESVIQQVRDWWQDGWQVRVATEQRERVLELLSEHDLVPGVEERSGGSLQVDHSPLQPGWSHPGGKLALVTDRELFGYRRQVRMRTRRQRSQPGLLESLNPGDYVVHVEHGIARYDGLSTIDATGADREYLVLQYAGNDRIYLPVDQIDRITRYESGGIDPKLTRLGSPEWSRAKQRVRQSVRELAFELLQLYAAREANEGVQFPRDTSWDVELEESFPFDETPDQLTAINAVKGDMETHQPMDRLVCGDVGYGKTEVALRAAFKAVNAGFQVAVLVPTTILALQHYYTFRERLAAFPVQVNMLSRLRSKAEQRKILDEANQGKIDILIGTHRLLQKDVRFSNLGLVVIDEEQRFGVAHKEQLKRLRANVDVLTMTATPIPRTLHMALSGIRDLSVINTPPQDRIPIRTFVSPESDHLIREAILRELGRGGQVYFVHNRVHSIHQTAARLADLVPEARIGVGHGQMDEHELEAVMLSFVQHEFDVLVCTTIIESGVDIPNTNTIIIDQAQNFGLTQLYQLRGRIGRSHQRAYAYLTYPGHQRLSTEAQARLEAIQEATDLGAGFQIALRDLEIRGAGNVLGAEQSGHIAAVGFDLYTRMLATAVEEIKQGRPIEEPEAVSVDLPVTAVIPPEYAGDEETRIELYKRIASAQSFAGLRDLQAELLDRFGPLPESVQTLFELGRLRVRASSLGITSVVERDGEIFIKPVLGTRLDQGALRRQLGEGVYVTPNQVRLVLLGINRDPLESAKAVVSAVEETGATVLDAAS